jgi:hypothetical protein
VIFAVTPAGLLEIQLWRCVIGRVVADVSVYRFAFMLSQMEAEYFLNNFTLNMKAL